ncbi:hypothetical protein MGYG_06491 [Nannizzia gypsea CBS 118893]|uniref:Uncharacterized protein n=1 Tax=Arthroderma gypseum (strain ATCC MYA-4604 / CBS 118893) TaxID=535722 RepID=E4UZG3_ARTGP|nr:hypothetical protein MGYG_06491 [Nannizzia gypsea CBS 118893]EFR03493.1 hypothetical protein MGYG_06491 [Nannizzia gypsea CBS 118893]
MDDPGLVTSFGPFSEYLPSSQPEPSHGSNADRRLAVLGDTEIANYAGFLSLMSWLGAYTYIETNEKKAKKKKREQRKIGFRDRYTGNILPEDPSFLFVSKGNRSFVPARTDGRDRNPAPVD